MDHLAAFFHEADNFARARELREALHLFEKSVPERIRAQTRSKLREIDELNPPGWESFERISESRTIGCDGLGWVRRDESSRQLVDWVGFGWYHDRLLDTEDRSLDPCRWIGWWNSGSRSDASRLFEKVAGSSKNMLSVILSRDLFDSEGLYGDDWPYFHGVPAPSPADLLRLDTSEFVAALSEILPGVRRAVEQAIRVPQTLAGGSRVS